MKRITSLLIAVLAMTSFMVSAGNDKPIAYEKLPQTARTFLQTHFPTEKVALSKMEKELFKTEYKVILVNGNEIEFDAKGEWKEVDCEYSFVPEAIVPNEIKKHIKSDFPDSKIIKIERNSLTYEVKLDTKIEVEYNLNFQVIDIDRD